MTTGPVQSNDHWTGPIGADMALTSASDRTHRTTGRPLEFSVGLAAIGLVAVGCVLLAWSTTVS
jgi:hypothetical protein